MKRLSVCLGVLLLNVLLAALGAAGWYGWRLWAMNSDLDARNLALEAECVRLRGDVDRLAAEARHERETRESVSRSLVAATTSCEGLRADCRRLQTEKDLAVKALREELRVAGVRVQQATAETAQANARAESEAKARAAAEAAARRHDEMALGVATLQELVELTDRAPRKPPAPQP